MKPKLLPCNNQIVVLSPPKKRGTVLTQIRHVRAELAQVYREGRSGMIDLADATKLTFILQNLARIISESDLEARIAKLEETQNGKTRK